MCVCISVYVNECGRWCCIVMGRLKEPHANLQRNVLCGEMEIPSETRMYWKGDRDGWKQAVVDDSNTDVSDIVVVGGGDGVVW